MPSNASNFVQMVQICIPVPFQCLKFAIDCFESGSNGSNLHSNGLNPFRIVGICIRISFEWFEFAFECFESRSKGSNLLLNASDVV